MQSLAKKNFRPRRISLGLKRLKRKWIAFLAKLHYYGNPSKKLKIIGVTGTNGKTTIATLLYQLFTKLGYRVGLISTNNVLIAGEEFTIERKNPTTPDVITLNKILAKMAKEKCQYVFMEVTSHAMDQARVAGVNFVGGVFTNLTHDHLDYHKSFDNYFRAKKKFFKMLPKGAFALSNIDDERGVKMIEDIKAKKYTYGLKSKFPLVKPMGLEYFSERLETKLIGEFNAYNALAVYATAVLLLDGKISAQGGPASGWKIKEIMKDLEGAEGRFNSIKLGSGATGIVDYAHSPDALENVLRAVQGLKKDNHKIITIFGCGGGERKDHTKRPIMTKIAYEMSDIIIPSADNPREEDIESIFNDMKAGLPDKISKEVYFIADRGEAVKKACKLAKDGDYILIAGKGHEKYQEIKGVKVPYNDMEELKKYLK